MTGGMKDCERPCWGPKFLLSDVWRTCDKIRAAVFRSGLNLWTYFGPLDPDKNCLISESQFVNILAGPLKDKIGLCSNEIAQLADYFRVYDGRIFYTQFCKIIHDTVPDIYKNAPLITGLEWSDPYHVNTLSPAEECRLRLLLAKIATLVQLRHLVLRPYFQDYELIAKNTGTVTIYHFSQVLHYLKILLSRDDFHLLIKKFGRDNYTVNYVAFVSAVENITSDLHGQALVDIGGGVLRDYPGTPLSAELPKLARPEIGTVRTEVVFGTPNVFHPVLEPPRRHMPTLETLRRFQQFVLSNRVRVGEFFKVIQGLRPDALRARDGVAVPARAGPDGRQPHPAPLPLAERGGPPRGRVPRAQRPGLHLLPHLRGRHGPSVHGQGAGEVPRAAAARAAARREPAAAQGRRAVERDARVDARHVRGGAGQGAQARAEAPHRPQGLLRRHGQAQLGPRAAGALPQGAAVARAGADDARGGLAGGALQRRVGLQLQLVPPRGGAQAHRGAQVQGVHRANQAHKWPAALPTSANYTSRAQRYGNSGKDQGKGGARGHPRAGVPAPLRRAQRGEHLVRLLLPRPQHVPLRAHAHRDEHAGGRVQGAHEARARELQAVRDGGGGGGDAAGARTRAAHRAPAAPAAPRQLDQLPRLRPAQAAQQRHGQGGRAPFHELRGGLRGPRPHGRGHGDAGAAAVRAGHARGAAPAERRRGASAAALLQRAARHQRRLRLPRLLPRRPHPHRQRPAARLLSGPPHPDIYPPPPRDFGFVSLNWAAG